jgi:pimeloyl-ACP methyl ester carboxylesterase
MRGIEARQKELPEEGRARLQRTLINEAGIWKEFFEDLPPSIAQHIDPAVFQLGWSKICSPGVLDAMLDLHMDYESNIRFYQQIQAYFRNAQLPTLLLWGERDQYLSIDAAEAYKRDLPQAQIVNCDGGHWLLESHPDDVNKSVRRFLLNAIGRSLSFGTYSRPFWPRFAQSCVPGMNPGGKALLVRNTLQ